jgi:hypothetical protein
MDDKELQSYNNNVATIRTSASFWWVGLVLYVINKFTGVNWAFDDEVVLLAVPVIGGFFYRLSLVLSQKVAWWGILLFLINRNPGYNTKPAGEPVPEGVDAPQPDRGDISNQTLYMLAAIAIIVAAGVYVFVTLD